MATASSICIPDLRLAMPDDIDAKWRKNNADPDAFDWANHHADAGAAEYDRDSQPPLLELDGRPLTGFLATPAENEAWDSITPQQLREKLQALENAPQNAANSNREMGTQGRFPATFLFQTREGDQGILQILGYADARSRMKLRYRLVQPPSTTPSAQHSPNPS